MQPPARSRRSARLALRARALAPLLLALCACGATGRHAGGPGAPRPNVLLVVTDDQGWNDVGWRDPRLRTPRLDALAREGARLEQHYVQPQCTPTRVALLTGRYPSRFGPHCTQASNEPAFPAGTPTLARLLRDAGWATGTSGKWHLGSRPEAGPLHHGFQHAHGSLAGAVGMYDHRYRLGSPFQDTWHRDHVPLEQHGHVTDLVADEAVAWIEGHADEPWFYYVAFHAVHTPLVERDPRWIAQNGHIADPDRRLFAAALSHLDDALGRLLDALEQSGQDRRTIVVLLSDNGGIHTAYAGGNYPPPDPPLRAGFSSNDPLRGGKTTVYEGGLRVPAVVRWPGRLPARLHAAPLHCVDWLPTLARWLELDLDPSLALDGRDVSAELAGLVEPGERTLYWVWGAARQRVALRRGRWKLLRDGPTAAFELYDLDADPGEGQDLAARRPDVVARLRALLAAERALDPPAVTASTPPPPARPTLPAAAR